MIKIIAAISQNHQIGLAGKMPWHIPEDLTYFKKITSGHPILMGRKTFESIGGPLPNRRNIIITRDRNYTAQGIETIHSLEEAFLLCQNLKKNLKDIFIIGGGELYTAFLPYADELYLTLIDEVVKGDTAFPYYKDTFQCTWSTPYYTNADGICYAFTVWQNMRNIIKD